MFGLFVINKNLKYIVWLIFMDVQCSRSYSALFKCLSKRLVIDKSSSRCVY